MQIEICTPLSPLLSNAYFNKCWLKLHFIITYTNILGVKGRLQESNYMCAAYQTNIVNSCCKSEMLKFVSNRNLCLYTTCEKWIIGSVKNHNFMNRFIGPIHSMDSEAQPKILMLRNGVESFFHKTFFSLTARYILNTHLDPLLLPTGSWTLEYFVYTV